jgi:hypothetical protein
MTPVQKLPGSRWFRWIQNLTVRVGVLTASYLIAVMVMAVLAANRMPLLEPVAEIRNWAARVTFALVMLIPVLSFVRSPARMIGSAALGWTIFTLAYRAMGIFFVQLHANLYTPFHLFMLGMAFYGVAAVTAWVLCMALDSRHQPITAPRRRLP